MSSRVKIALGCAQFGAAYGRAGAAGRLSDTSVQKIIEIAHDSGVEYLDTAAAYGDSEERLGRIGVSGFNVITKISGVELCNDSDLSGRLEGQIKISLSRLCLAKVYGVLIHDFADLQPENRLDVISALNDAKEKGLVDKIGVSVYSPDDIDLQSGDLRFDVVQAPLNVFDSRMIDGSVAEQLSLAGIEFHARSIFLQGLLLMNSHERPKVFMPWAKTLRLWDEFCADLGISKLQACRAFVTQSPEVTRAVVGVDSEAQLEEVLQKDMMIHDIDFPDFKIAPDDILIDPRRWSL